ncbi:MAG TPA: leucyl aminopeptidase family protein, partial [Pseudolabrys sp.]|nr:leucyl aminopeptidase family protein [Pseudolabrys sp.]
MHPVFVGDSRAVPICFATPANFTQVTATLGERERTFVNAAGFEPKPGKLLLIPDADGNLANVLFGLEPNDDPAKDLFRPGALAGLLPPGTYRFATAPHDARLGALAFALGSYQFTRYRNGQERKIRLVLPEGVDGE